jgi:hypothetical protein
MDFRLLCAASSLLATTAARPVYAQSFLSPPHASSLHFVQYGVSLTTENLASAGGVCTDKAVEPCILGSGLGITIRMGYRSHGPLYIGGAYEATRHDSSNILRLAILQQIRGEVRYLFDQGTRLSPFALGGAGLGLFGNEWGVETLGPSLHVGVGVEYQASEAALVGLGLTWRGITFREWTDTTGQRRANDLLGFALSQWIAFEITLEIRKLLPRW